MQVIFTIVIVLIKVKNKSELITMRNMYTHFVKHVKKEQNIKSNY